MTQVSDRLTDQEGEKKTLTIRCSATDHRRVAMNVDAVLSSLMEIYVVLIRMSEPSRAYDNNRMKAGITTINHK